MSHTDPAIARPMTKRAQVRALLEEMVATQLKPGQPIPSERGLVRQLGVSRVTVRQAITDLVEAGGLERVHGKGTFVTGPQLDTRLYLNSFSREMRARGLQPESVVLEASEEPAEAEVAAKLQIRLGAPVVRVVRLRLADGTPIAHEVGYYPANLFPGLLQHELSSLYDAFANVYGVRVTSAEQTVRADTADAKLAEVLGISKRSALLVQERVTWAGDEVMELSTSCYRGDRYRIQMKLSP